MKRLKNTMKINTLAAIFGFSAFATLYTYAMGQSAIHDSATSIIDNSYQLADQWATISNEFAIKRSSTSVGDLYPVVPEQFSGLDLAVYGTEPNRTRASWILHWKSAWVELY